VTEVRLRATVSSAREVSPGAELPYVALEHVESLTGAFVQGFRPETKAATAEVLFRRGDVLFGKLRPYLAKVIAPDFDGCASGEFLVLRPRPSMDSRFLYYLCLSRPLLDWAVATSVGTKMPRTDWEQLSSFPLRLPSPPQQRAIADFLDRETARIGGLVDAKRRLLALLDERWGNRVVGAVTRGISSEHLIPIDSPWFPRMPANWRLEPLKRRWTVIDCKHRTPQYVNEGYPLVSHAEIQDGRVRPGRSWRFVSKADYMDLIEGRRPQRGDIIYTRNAAIGNAGYVDTDTQFAMGQDVCLITSEDQDQRFLTYFLNYVASEQLAAKRLGVTFGRFNVSQIVDLEILCPPLREQRFIADYLGAHREEYETLSTKLRRQIELLDEHREVLITAAVTGQASRNGGRL
jgi:type I restriction enzyme, S subunit